MDIDKVLDYAFKLWGHQIVPENRVTHAVSIKFFNEARITAANKGEEKEFLEGYGIGLRKLGKQHDNALLEIYDNL